MDNLIKVATSKGGREVITSVCKSGKYCFYIAVGFMIYNLFDKAISNDCSVNLTANTEGVSFTIEPATE